MNEVGITKLVDDAVKAFEELAPRRTHLGASSLGNPCMRAMFYGFNWCVDKEFDGRLHRLFKRGHEEEFRFSEYLRRAGYEVRDYAQRLLYHPESDSYLPVDWDYEWGHGGEALYVDVSESRMHIELATERGQGPKQWNFQLDCDTDGVTYDWENDPCPSERGHIGGSSDGKIRGPILPDGWGMLECKTHNEKSFTKLAGSKKKWDEPRIFDPNKHGVKRAKREHFVQMQIYMDRMKLPWCLYAAVNKNTDELYFEVVQYQPEVARTYLSRGIQVVQMRTAPEKAYSDPSRFECKFCDYAQVCHFGAEPAKNCRSCAYSSPGPTGVWGCNLHRAIIPDNFIPSGCDKWEALK